MVISQNMFERMVIAGASGFIGRSLIEALDPRQPIIGLSRQAKEPLDGHRNVEWRACNLFELRETERALEGAKVAVYLVHSMLPQESLIRGGFEDMDLLCADNFARAAQACGVRQIVYLSGLVPDDEELSRHLASRLEVERTFDACPVRSTTLRAGMVIGPGGSSFQLMSRLVERLPVIVAPKWTRSKSQAVALRDVVGAMLYTLGHPEKCAGTWDIGCPEVLTYRDMMVQTAEALGKKPRVVDVPFNAPKLSLMGVSWMTDTPRRLVLPLVQSLRHTMVAKEGLRLQKFAGISPTPFKQAVRDALDGKPPKRLARRARRQPRKGRRTILFVQRMPMPEGATALWAVHACERWLSQILNPFVKLVVRQAHVYRFCVPGSDVCLLELTFSPDQSCDTRQVFYVSGGLLPPPGDTGQGVFEFRSVLENKYVVLVVHDSVSHLRWLPHKASQAALYALIVKLFGRHMKRTQAPPTSHARRAAAKPDC